MRWPRIIFISILALLIGAFLHYTLPQRDIVRIVNVESRLTEVGGLNGWFYAQRDSGTAQSTGMRDIRLISTIRPDGRPLVYRNEDTGLLWPPYFKFDSEDLQAEAANLASTEATPQWVAITHYGWRSNLLSIYPNAVTVRPVAGPDVSLFPWLNIVILLGIALVIFFAWRIWERFEDRVIEPMVDWFAVRWAKMKDWAAGRR
ncbi:DUF1523 family protein [Roseibacterium sp. SDUM158016]|jgi:hypothetical protein|uniref:DUF1523 family protein n=1 Tax=Roseicyclus sediminis TaxID=2980997 RepID=UPI0021D2D3BE|nr:DUF1523 family protein [Roseibacterium sp. SDUM158016]MCU4651262.1 DUF1523 family protein [Roseibacterium sp. SDUM158016]